MACPEVFLSFQGDDTRRNFVSHLYRALELKGIGTFKDDKRLEIGDYIPESLRRAIQGSKFAITVISRNYASSHWCLDELQLIVELEETKKLTVLPIFYEVKPSEVGKQTGSFGAAFERYRNDPRFQIWKGALERVSKISGLESIKFKDDEEVVSRTVKKVSSELAWMRPTDFSHLVGVEAHMNRINALLNIENENEVRVIGIWGMRGTGKTTIANYVYSKISNKFQAQCFLRIVKEREPVDLQKEMLSAILGVDNWKFSTLDQGSAEIKARLRNLKVLVILDGVDDVKQLHALAKETQRSGPGSYGWFGLGSRIIITAHDKGLLRCIGVGEDRLHKVKCLDDQHALLLFNQVAFRGELPPDVCDGLLKRACQLAGGLPSVLTDLGLYLGQMRYPNEWQTTLSRLENAPHESIMEILHISYERLGSNDRTVFLRIACLFNVDRVKHVIALLNDGNSEVTWGIIKNLVDKSLVDLSADECEITVHNIVARVARELVRREHPNRPQEQRILWDPQDICDILEQSHVTAQNEGMLLHICEIIEDRSMSGRVFEPKHNLKFLKMYKHDSKEPSRLQLTEDVDTLPRNLRLLHWDGYPMKSLPTRFRSNCLVELSLRYSILKTLWGRTLKLPKLRRLDLTGSENLKELSNLSNANNLKELMIRGCTRLKLTKASFDELKLRLETFDHDDHLPDNFPRSRVRLLACFTGGNIP